MNDPKPGDRFVVAEHIPLETARKDICWPNGEPWTGDKDQISEWAMAYALSRFEIGQEISFEDFHKAMNEGMMTQILSKLVDDGLVDAIWDEKSGEVVFKAKQ